MAVTDTIESVVEALSAAVVLLEPDDLNSLADLHSLLREVEAWAEAGSLARTAAATAGACQLIEQVILQESGDPESAVRVLADTVSSLQQVIRGQFTDAQVDFPPALGIPSRTVENAAPALSGTQPPYSFTISLPPYVDDAIFGEFLQRQESVLEEMESSLLKIEQANNPEALRIINRHLHTLKGETALLGITDIEQLCHTAEDLLDRDNPAEVVDRLLSLKDWLKQAFDSFAGHRAAPAPAASIMAQLKGAGPRTPAPTEHPANGGNAVLSAPAEAIRAGHAPPATVAPTWSAPDDRRLTGDKDLIADFITEAGEHLEKSDIELLTLETEPHNQTSIDAVFRAFHTIKGVCGFIDLSEMQALAHECENLLDRVRKGQLELSGPYLDIVFESIDMLKTLLAQVRDALEHNTPLALEPGLPGLIEHIQALTEGRSPAVARSVDPAVLANVLEAAPGTPRLGDILVEIGAASRSAVEQALATQKVQAEDPEVDAPPKLGEVLVKQAAIPASEVAVALRAQKLLASDRGAIAELGPEHGAVGPQEASGITVRETVKVDAIRLDQLVDMIGELVIAESMVCQSPELKAHASTWLARHVGQLDKITRELQEMAMGLRMVPVRSTFQKMARLVRDLAKKTGKEVNFAMYGEDTELDKTVVDRISDPLVHMIRNSVDHGLESTSAERRAVGKSSAGTVSLSARHCGGNILIEIEDDGKGLDRNAILQKARERGLIADSGDSLSNKEVWQLIFEPGFSTAKQITEVSGRGVGMDVVKRNIDELRGEIDIHSDAGRGSRFTIRLPLTLAIIDGMIIRTGAERYIIPTLSIVVSVRPKPSDLGTVAGHAETMMLQGEVIPLFRLHTLFDIAGAVTSPVEGTVVVLENGGRRVGLLVDGILGQQQIVIKPLGEYLRGARGLAGGAIMPDGKVGLIIDVGELVRLATEAAPN